MLLTLIGEYDGPRQLPGILSSLSFGNCCVLMVSKPKESMDFIGLL